MNKKMIGFVALAIFITGSVFILMSSDSSEVKSNSTVNNSNTTYPKPNSSSTPAKVEQNTNIANTTTSNTSTKVNPEPTGFTMADVSKHNSTSSCWTAVYGNVYDLTSFIGQHPGGSRAIMSLCGTDGTSAFDDQHGGQRRANAELANHKIGALLK